MTTISPPRRDPEAREDRESAARRTVLARLRALADRPDERSITPLFTADPIRAQKFSAGVDKLPVNFSRFFIDDAALDGLFALADAAGRDAFRGRPRSSRRPRRRRDVNVFRDQHETLTWRRRGERRRKTVNEMNSVSSRVLPACFVSNSFRPQNRHDPMTDRFDA